MIARVEEINKKTAKNFLSKRINCITQSYHMCSRLFSKITYYNKSWAIIGGAPRVWATDIDRRPNDIDIVVGGKSSCVEKIIYELILEFDEIDLLKTKFGGFRLRTDNLTIDIWAAKETIGISKNKFVDTNLYRAVSKSAALSLDSLVFTSYGTLYERGFFDTLKTGILRLNHSKIEQSKSIALKSIRLCNEFNLIPDIILQSLIFNQTGIEYKKTEYLNQS